jgi:hypothetical protein
VVFGSVPSQYLDGETVPILRLNNETHESFGWQDDLTR